jgi:hypothetical protein
MAGVPTARTDLSATASSNSPQGSDTVGASTGPDDYLRAHASLIRANYDDILLKAPLASPTFTGHVTVEGVTATGATGTGKFVFDASPTLTGTVVIPTPFTLGAVSVTATGAELNYVAGVTSALQTQLNAKAPLASPTFTTAVALPASWSVGGVTILPTGAELNYVDGVTSAIQTQLNAKAPLASPTFTGTVAGITATMVGLGNVTNESKATMFTTATFTGTTTLAATAFGNSALSGIKTAGFNSEVNAGTNTALSPDFANGQKQYCTMGAGTTTITLNTGQFPAVGHYQLRIIQDSTARALAFAGTAYDAGRWLNDADANDVNSANSGQSILTIFWNGTNAYLSMAKVGAV